MESWFKSNNQNRRDAVIEPVYEKYPEDEISLSRVFQPFYFRHCRLKVTKDGSILLKRERSVLLALKHA